MFFWKKEKTPEQKMKDDKVMWIHDHSTYLTYIDDTDIGKKEIHFEGPHVKGISGVGEELLILSAEGEELGVLKITHWETKKQGTLLGSVNTGEYLILTGTLEKGDKYDQRHASMLVNANIFS